MGSPSDQYRLIPPLYDIVEKPTIKGLVKARSWQYQEKAYLCP